MAWLVVFAFLTGCEIQESFKYEPSNSDGKLDITAWEFIQSNNDFSQLEKAITLTGLQDVYHQQVRTFILPNDKAFDSYLSSSSYASIEDIPLPILRNMLRYHVVKDRVIFSDPLITRDRPLPYETENGQTMFLSRNNNYIGQINQGTSRQWEIRTSNLEPTNGVIHVVNHIVYFSAPTIEGGDETTLETEMINPLHDSFVAGFSPGDEDFRSVNYGTHQFLRPKRTMGAGTGTYDRRAFIMFDLDELQKSGIVVDVKLRFDVWFSRGGYSLDLYHVPNSSWSESTINYNNAPASIGGRIANVMTKAISNGTGGPYEFDVTNFFQNESPTGKISFMLDTEPWPNGTDELASKDHPTLNPPALIVTLATGVSNLMLETNETISVSNGGSVVVTDEMLKISGAEPADIVYSISSLPTKGWLIRGADVLDNSGEFTQMDLQSLSLVYIHDGESSGEDTLVLNAKDKTGAVVEDIMVKVNIQ